MAESAVGFSPGHISGYFRRFDGESPDSTGSCGGGIVIDKGVHAWVRPAEKTSVEVHRACTADEDTRVACTSPLVEYALHQMGVTAEVKT
ncbi:MAG: GHMP kinase, partial [Methanomicrobiales archaeon]|nr:GHMP kinase [Methanomicrobiales archaeon]